MPRRAREQSPTGIYHVIMRGINRQSIFEDYEDRLILIDKLAKFRVKSSYRIFAYCLMDNHIHLLIQEQKDPIGKIIKRISSSYVFWFNNKYERCGHLFQDRFKSEAVDSERYFLTVLRYIHQNPLKAKITDDISKYPWSSYGEYIGKGTLVDTEYVLKMFADIPEAAVRRFDEFLREGNEDECLEIEEIKIVSDQKLKEVVKKQFGIEAIRIAHEEKENQVSILRELKKMRGVSIRQISRITGISNKRVWKI